jgi:hypothetical protein
MNFNDFKDFRFFQQRTKIGKNVLQWYKQRKNSILFHLFLVILAFSRTSKFLEITGRDNT